MTDHIQVTFRDIQPEQQEWVIAHLAEAGYEGFEEEENILKAFIPERDFDKDLLKEISFKYQLDCTVDVIKARNWNQVWESHFHPVTIDDFVHIRAPFHPVYEKTLHELVITPKMSFGTGHHTTTRMMIEEMRDIDFKGKSVFDFGTGTGVLAILSERLGASEIVAIDIDEWSIQNAEENLRINNCTLVKLYKKDSADLQAKYDIILANINRNVILDNIEIIASQLNSKGILVISGFLEQDMEDLISVASSFNLQSIKKNVKDNWVCLKFQYQG